MSPYAIFFSVAFVLGLLVANIHAISQGQSQKQTLQVLVVASIFALFGAKIFHCLFEARGHVLPDESVAQDVFDLLSGDIWHWARIFDPGFVFFGGLLTSFAITSWYAHFAQIEQPLIYADGAALGAASGLFLGRIGCFMAGCCYGQVGIFPVQLVESAFSLLCFCGLWAFRGQKWPPGMLFRAWLFAYATFRLVIECFREDWDRGIWFFGFLSTSQAISLCVIFGLIAQRKRSDRWIWQNLG